MNDLNIDMSLDDAVPSESKYLKKEDVGLDGKVLTVAGMSRADISKDNEPADHQTLLKFAEFDKPMVLKITNKQLLKLAIFGDANVNCTIGQLVGKQVLVFNDPTVDFAGKIVGGIRIKAAPAAPPVGGTMPAAEAVDKFGDDVPF